MIWCLPLTELPLKHRLRVGLSVLRLPRFVPGILLRLFLLPLPLFFFLLFFFFRGMLRFPPIHPLGIRSVSKYWLVLLFFARITLCCFTNSRVARVLAEKVRSQLCLFSIRLIMLPCLVPIQGLDSVSRNWLRLPRLILIILWWCLMKRRWNYRESKTADKPYCVFVWNARDHI